MLIETFRGPAPGPDPDLTAALAALEAFCPFLGPSLQRGMMTAALHHAEGDLPTLRRQLFGAALEHAEQLRTDRDTPAGLHCRILAVRWQPPSETTHEALIDHVHWLIKNLYAPLAVMAGKYARDTTDDRYPRSAVSFLALRSAVPRHDGAFLAATPTLAEQIRTGLDDGRSPFAAVPGLDHVPATRTAATDPDVHGRVQQWARQNRPLNGSARVPRPRRAPQPRSAPTARPA